MKGTLGHQVLKMLLGGGIPRVKEGRFSESGEGANVVNEQ